MAPRNLARLVAEHQSMCNRESYRDFHNRDSLTQGGPRAWLTDADHNVCGPKEDCKKRTSVVRSGQLRIHTFWARTLWFNTNAFEDEGPDPFIPEDIYIRLIPALELASAMLDLSDEFMIRVLCAPMLTKHNETTGKEDVSLDPDYEVTEADRIKYKQFLCQLPDYQLVYFGHPVSHFDSEGDFIYASCGHEAPDEDGPFLLYYNICSSFIDFYNYAQWKTFRDEHIRLVHFHFALILIHEFAHGVLLARVANPLFANKADSDEFRREKTESSIHPEFLIHPDHHRAELGFAWEYYFFGFILGLYDSREIEGFTDPNTVISAYSSTRGSFCMTDDIVQVLSDKIYSSTLSTETLARVAADGTSLELINMASKLVARGRQK